MVRPRLLLPLVLFGCAPTGMLHAGDAAFIRAHYVHLEDASLGDDARMDGRETGLSLQSPTFDVLGGRFAVGADYVYTHYAYTDVASRDRDLHRLAVPLHWSTGDATVFRATLTPTVATSSNVMKDLFKRGTSEDVNFYGEAVAERIPDTGWGWRAGAGYDDRFGDPEAYPVLMALHRGERTSLQLGWPQTRFDWRAHERVRLGVNVEPAGGQWHVVSDERDGAEFDYTVEAWRAALTAHWAFAEGWSLGAQLGSEFDRHHDFEDDLGVRLDVDAGSTAFAELLVRYRFGADDEWP